jgi:hypothetical protein
MQAKLVLALVQVCHQVSEGRTDCVHLHDLPCAADLGALPDPVLPATDCFVLLAMLRIFKCRAATEGLSAHPSGGVGVLVTLNLRMFPRHAAAERLSSHPSGRVGVLSTPNLIRSSSSQSPKVPSS